MRDLAGVVLSVALPWVAGTLWVRALWRGEQDGRGALSVGYGYFAGAFAVTLLMRLIDLAGERWTLGWIALPLFALAAAAWFSARSQRSLRRDWRRAAASFAAAPVVSHRLFWLFLAFCASSVLAMTAFVAWSLLTPYDAMAQWADKARVWYEFGRLLPFVGAEDWSRYEDALHFWDPNPSYPATAPLLQVWTALSLGHWDESLINMPWVAAFVALGFAFYGQVRRLDAGPAKSIACTYLVLSLPYLQVQVALAGMVDIFIAAAYALAAMSFWHWVRAQQRQDAVLAVAMVILVAALKREGILWALTFAPALFVAFNRRIGLSLTVLLGAAAVAYALFGPAEVKVMGYLLRTRFENVSFPAYQHLFLMDNWHLLWYAAIAVIAFNGARLLAASLAPVTVTMLAALGLVAVVFFFSSAAGGVAEESLLNRFVLQLVPALAFYLVLILREGERRTLAGSTSAAPAAPAA